MSNRHEPSFDAREQDHADTSQIEGHEDELDSAERATAVLLAVSHALTGWDSFERASERLLRDLADALGLAAGALWLPTGETLVASTIWSTKEVDRMALEGALRPLRLTRGSCLPGRAWERREPTHRAMSTGSGGAERWPSAPDGLRAHVALPAWTGEEVLGVIELYAASNAEFNTRLMHVLSTAGHLLGTLFSRRRGELKLSPLTARELEVLTLAAQGKTGRRIAEQLEISPATVKTHFEHIFSKLEVGDRTSAVAQALRGGLIG
jgi:DNA-binding CsgD family transcriptional regulator